MLEKYKVDGKEKTWVVTTELFVVAYWVAS